MEAFMLNCNVKIWCWNRQQSESDINATDLSGNTEYTVMLQVNKCYQIFDCELHRLSSNNASPSSFKLLYAH